MKWTEGFSPFDDHPQPVEIKSFGLVGVNCEQILEITTMFRDGERAQLISVLRDETGHPWAARTLQDQWDDDEAEARSRGLFDLIWHRRAMQVDPMVVAPDFAGFDVLMQVAHDVCPQAAGLLEYVNACNTSNERRHAGPEWWAAWHAASETKSGGWLDHAEARKLAACWSDLATPEVELACLEVMGASYTHSGSWTLLTNLGGFFAQCGAENRSVVCEIDT